MKKKTFLLTMMIPLIGATTFTACKKEETKTKTDFDIIKENYQKHMIANQSTKTYDDKTLYEIKQTLQEVTIANQETYKFKDIDYTLDQDRSSWPAGGHLGRTLQLTVLSVKKEDKEMKDIALKLLYHWVYSNYRNTNWWQNEIGANQNLSNIAMFLYDDLTPKGQEALKGKLYESSIYHRPSLSTHEGSNLLNYVEMTIKTSVLDKISEEIDVAITSAAGAIKDDGIESYQKDGSFFQHGKLLQTGSYGIEGTAKIANVITMLKGTSKSLPQDKLYIISNYILNGLKSMSHRGMYNYMALGRAYSRVNALDIEAGTYKVSDMAKFTALDNMPNKDEINAYIKDVKDRTCTTFIQGPVAYNNCKALVYNSDGVYMCFKGTNPDMTNTECVNHENCLGYNLSYGQNTCVMQSGKEYYNISPIWDYTKIPGSSSRDFGNTQGTFNGADSAIDSYVKETIDNGLYEALLPTINPNTSTRCTYALGKEKGVAYSMTQSVHDITTKNETGGVEFTSTCFMTDDGMFILGSGLDNKQPNLDQSQKILHTTLEQCRLNEGDVDPEISQDKLSVTKDKVIYKSLSNQPLTLDIENRVGNWQRNNPSLTSKEETGKVMTIMINKDKTDTSGAYAYAVQPASKKDNNVEVIFNTPELAVIKLPSDKLAACFYQVSQFDYQGKTYRTEKVLSTEGAFEVFDIIK